MEELIILYGVTGASSLIYNTMFFYNLHRKAKKSVKRKYKFQKNLSFTAKKEMNLIFLSTALDGVINSLIPVKNVIYTLENIECHDIMAESFEEEYDLVAMESAEKTNNIKKLKYENKK